MFLHLLNVITAYRPNKFSKQIKKATKEKHDAIEKHPFIKSMIDGSLSDFKYAIYLNNLLPIYKAVEMFLFYSTPVDRDLLQSRKINNDLNEYIRFLGINIDRPEYIFNKEWLNYFLFKDKFLQKAELYIRWLADMYGGQIIKRNIRFNSKYDFDDLRNEIKLIRRMIEDGLDETNVDRFIEEVNKAYEFHHQLADKINELPERSL
jgi:heme oxygenase